MEREAGWLCLTFFVLTFQRAGRTIILFESADPSSRFREVKASNGRRDDQARRQRTTAHNLSVLARAGRTDQARAGASLES